MEFRFYVFTNLSTNPTHSVGTIFRCAFLPAAFGNRRPPVATSFAARFYLPLYFSDGLRRRYPSLYVFYLPLYFSDGLRRLHLSLHGER